MRMKRTSETFLGFCLISTLAHAAWQPLDQELVNQSTEPWTIDFSATPTARMGCSMLDGTPMRGLAVPPTECTGSKVLPPGARMYFYVETPGPVAPLAFSLRGPAPGGEWRGSVELLAPGPGSRFVHPGPEQENLAVSWSAKRITLHEQPVRGEGKEELNTGAATPVAAAPAPVPGEGKGELAGGETREDGAPTETKATKATATLPKLSEYKLEAGLQNSAQYWTLNKITLTKDWSGELHDFGHILPPEVLADIFMNTVFQFDVLECTGYSPHLDYERIWSMKFSSRDYYLKVGLNKLSRNIGPQFDKIKRHSDEATHLNEFIAATEKALRALQQDRDFRALGVAYMRQKIVVEKLAQLAESLGEVAQKAMYERDRLTTDLQTMIYYWIDQAFVEFVHQYRAASPEAREAVELSMASFRPAFLAEPYYDKIIKDLRHYTDQTRSVEGMALPTPPRPH